MLVCRKSRETKTWEKREGEMKTGGDEWIPLFKNLTERLLVLDKFWLYSI